MTIQMKATEKYFPVVLFFMLFKVYVTFDSMGEATYMKAPEQYCTGVLFIELVI